MSLRGALFSCRHSTASAFLCHFEISSLISFLPLRTPLFAVSLLAMPVNSLSLPRVQKSPVTSHTHSAEQVQNQQDDQDHPDNPNASARPPSPISVIASTAAKQEQQNNNEQEQSHGNLLSVAEWLRPRPAAWSFRRFSQGKISSAFGLVNLRTTSQLVMVVRASHIPTGLSQ
jgi:hypothetical protein